MKIPVELSCHYHFLFLNVTVRTVSVIYPQNLGNPGVAGCPEACPQSVRSLGCPCTHFVFGKTSV